MDLFYQGTFEEQISSLKKDIRKLAKSSGITFRHKLLLLWGSKENINNNILFIQPPYPGGKYFKDKDTEKLINTLNKYEISKYFITYCYHLLSPKITRKLIKQYSGWIKKLVDFVQPRLIVCLGEESIFSLFKRKSMIQDHHGKVFGIYQEIPVLLTYPMSYYYEKSEYEDVRYKNFLMDNDWNAIRDMYRKEIKDAII